MTGTPPPAAPATPDYTYVVGQSFASASRNDDDDDDDNDEDDDEEDKVKVKEEEEHNDKRGADPRRLRLSPAPVWAAKFDDLPEGDEREMEEGEEHDNNVDGGEEEQDERMREGGDEEADAVFSKSEYSYKKPKTRTAGTTGDDDRSPFPSSSSSSPPNLGGYHTFAGELAPGSPLLHLSMTPITAASESMRTSTNEVVSGLSPVETPVGEGGGYLQQEGGGGEGVFTPAWATMTTGGAEEEEEVENTPASTSYSYTPATGSDAGAAGTSSAVGEKKKKKKKGMFKSMSKMFKGMFSSGKKR